MRTAFIAIGASAAIAIVVAGVEASQPIGGKALFPRGRSVAVWQWTAPDTESAAAKRQHADALRSQGIGDVYIDISSYNDHDEVATPLARGQQVAAFTKGLREEVSLLADRGIKAHALAGNVRWANPDYNYIPLKLMDFVHTYNQAAPPNARLAGIQFDIEFYNSKDFTAGNARQYIADYLSLVEQLVAKQQRLDASLDLSFAIPVGFDGSDARLALPGKAIMFQLADRLQQLRDGTIALMDYRRQTGGPDGSIARAVPLLRYLRAYTPSVHVLIGQETTNVQPAKITFYGQGKTALRSATVQIDKALGVYPQYQGFVINDQPGFLRL